MVFFSGIFLLIIQDPCFMVPYYTFSNSPLSAEDYMNESIDVDSWLQLIKMGRDRF